MPCLLPETINLPLENDICLGAGSVLCLPWEEEEEVLDDEDDDDDDDSLLLELCWVENENCVLRPSSVPGLLSTELELMMATLLLLAAMLPAWPGLRRTGMFWMPELELKLELELELNEEPELPAAAPGN